MAFVVFGVCLFVVLLSTFLLLMPRASAAGALLREATKPMRVRPELPAWRVALNVEYVAKPFTRFRSLFSDRPDPTLAKRLMLAGYTNPAHVDIFSGARLAVPAFLGLLVALLVNQGTITFFLLSVVVGFFAPDFWLSWAIKRHREMIRISLPDGLDFLAICLEAGLGLDQALARVGQELRLSHPELSEELLQMNREQRAGVARIAAWQNFSERVNLESVRSFVAMLVQTERFGTPISRSLGIFSDTLRLQRRQKAEEAAAKTTIKLVPPLVFFVLPSVIIVCIGPAVISVINGLEHFLK